MKDSKNIDDNSNVPKQAANSVKSRSKYSKKKLDTSETTYTDDKSMSDSKSEVKSDDISINTKSDTTDSSKYRYICRSTSLYLSKSLRSPVIGYAQGKCKLNYICDHWMNITIGIPGFGAKTGFIYLPLTSVLSI